MRGFARSVETADVVTGEGSLDVMRYGQPLRAAASWCAWRASMGWNALRGFATHRIKPGEYKESFVLKRNALIANTPVVPSLPF